MFDLSNITLAFSTAAQHEEAFGLMCEDMRTWFEAGEFPSNKDLGTAIVAGLPHLSAGTVKVYASRMLAWAKAGRQPASLHAMVKDGPKAKGKGGRPKGKPETDMAQGEAPAVPNEDRAWVQFIEGIRAQVPGRRDWASEDIVAMQDCAAKMIALIKRNIK